MPRRRSPWSMPLVVGPVASLAKWVVTLAIAGIALGSMAGCTAQELVAIMPGVLNNPNNLGLRRAILSFGTDQMCDEVQKRSVPLRLRPEDPVIGRFYVNSCTAQELETGNLFLQFAGQGYAWSNVTLRTSFQASGAVELAHDFQLDGDTMYIYFRQRSMPAQKFDVGLIERPASGPLSALQGDPQAFTQNLGAQVMAAELSKGFTVIREPDGSAAFGLGLVPLGQRPPEPFQRTSDDRVLLENSRIEIHQNQRDYAGPYEIPDDDMALYVTANVEGAPAIDFVVVNQATGSEWLQTYVTAIATSGPPRPPLAEQPAFSGAVFTKKLKLPKGLYYLVLDNTATAGPTAPTSYAYDDRAALVSLAVELGDAD